MSGEWQIIRSAQHMIERYGTSALQQVENRITELGAHGRNNTLRHWQDIHQAVRKLQKTPGDPAGNARD